MKRLLTSIAVVSLLPVAAIGAQLVVTYSSTNPSTGMTLTAISPCSVNVAAVSCPGAMAAGAQLATITVQSASGGWAGVVTVGAPFTGSGSATSFAVGGTGSALTLNAGSAGLPAGTSAGAVLTSTP